MVKDLTLKKAELKKKLDLKIAELEKKRNDPKDERVPIPDRHMEAMKELIKNKAVRGNEKESIHTDIATYRKDYDLPREKFFHFPHALFEQIYKENYKEKPPNYKKKPSKPSKPSPEKSPAAEAEAGAEAGAEV